MSTLNKKVSNAVALFTLCMFGFSFITLVVCIGLIFILAGLSLAGLFVVTVASKIVVATALISLGICIVFGFMYKMVNEVLFDGNY